MNKPDHPHLTHQILKERLEGGILTELLPYRQWVVWRYSLVKGRWKKPPFHPANGRAAKNNDRKTWGTFSQAFYRLETGTYHGIGFVFTDEDSFTGTDLDIAVNEDSTIAEWVQLYVDALDSHIEYSPFRRGLHILTKARLAGTGKKVGAVEMYATTHYFTITADHVPGTTRTINERADVQTLLYESLKASISPEGIENNGVYLGERILRSIVRF